MQGPKTKKALRRDETRAALVTAARRLFGRKGFAETGTEEIVAAAKVTRGALYYHFQDKAALFDAVVETVAADILAAIERAATAEKTPLDGLIAGCRAWLDACLAPAVRRIWVLDAPSVLGPKRLREIDGRYALGSLREGVDAVLAGTKADLSPEALAALLSGALDEAVLWLVQNDDAASRRRLDTTLETLIRRTFSD
jgi:AcrR family transcriptional regulator